jgi:hypothetical protein
MLHFVLIGMALATGFVLFGLLLAGLVAVLAILVDLLRDVPRALKWFVTLPKEPCSSNPPTVVEPVANRIALAMVLFTILLALPLVAMVTR